jgi:hypothetical protein
LGGGAVPVYCRVDSDAAGDTEILDEIGEERGR